MTETSPHTLMMLLRMATQRQHAEAESRPLEQDLARGRLPKAAYIALLEQRLIVHTVLESLWRKAGEDDPRMAQLVDPELFQADNIRADLAYFERSACGVAALPSTCVMIDEFEYIAADCPASLVGAYYVFEGSKNGSRMLARVLRPIYQLPERDGTRYFDPHCDKQRELWGQFKQRVDELVFSDDEQTRMVVAAQRTFEHVGAMDEEIYTVSRAGAARAECAMRMCPAHVRS